MPGKRGDLPPDFEKTEVRDKYLKSVLGEENDFREQISQQLNEDGPLSGQVEALVGENWAVVLEPDNTDSFKDLVIACKCDDIKLKRVAEIFFEII